ncbi:hypothetical protein ANN_19024 [Periplaneta americana]|uniref:SWIM-type domain-containing protein n=1 Tax=Periplaneta americana TaxID=6978 RepID=A0ABQ8SQC4_PERAM|nr:hypothetical protein ANN_19024 [Periplaneta americana]
MGSRKSGVKGRYSVIQEIVLKLNELTEGLKCKKFTIMTIGLGNNPETVYVCECQKLYYDEQHIKEVLVIRAKMFVLIHCIIFSVLKFYFSAVKAIVIFTRHPEHGILPEQLTEEVQEARNKNFKKYHLNPNVNNEKIHYSKRNRHKSGTELDKDLIIREENGWTIPSSSDVKDVYFVQESALSCNCKLLCIECNTCIHQYTCTCMDSSIKWNMCKHIHNVCLLRVSQSAEESRPNTVYCNEEYDDLFINLDAENDIEKEEIVSEIMKKGDSHSSLPFTNQKAKVKAELMNLIDSVMTESELEVLKRHKASLQATLAANRLPLSSV